MAKVTILSGLEAKPDFFQPLLPWHESYVINLLWNRIQGKAEPEPGPPLIRSTKLD